MTQGPCSGHGFGCGCDTSVIGGKADDCSHVFRNADATFHGAVCGRCGMTFAEWGRRRDEEIAQIVDQRQTD